MLFMPQLALNTDLGSLTTHPFYFYCTLPSLVLHTLSCCGSEEVEYVHVPGWDGMWSDSASSSTKAFIAAAQLHSGEDTADLTPFSHQMQNQRTCNVSLFVCNQSQSTSKYMLIPVRQKYKYVCRKSVSKFVSECDKSGQQRAGNKFNLISVDDSYALPSAQATLPSPSTTHPPRPAL